MFNPNNLMYQWMNNPMMMNGLNQKLNEFAQQINGNPRDLTQQLLNNGQMSQDQFNQYRMIANMLTGKNY